MVSLPSVVLVLCLWCVQLLQWLSRATFPPASSLLTRLVVYLEGRREVHLKRLEEAARRACADRTAVRFVDEKEGLYTQLQRHGDLGSRHGKFWYRVTKGQRREKLLTVARLPSKCPLKLDAVGLKSLNTFFRRLEHPLLHPVEEVRYYQDSGDVVLVQPLMSRGSLKDIIHKTSPTFSWSGKYDKYGRSAVVATSGMLRTLNKLSRKQDQLLHSIQEVHYCPDSEQMRVVIVESESQRRSSLADLLNMTSPTKGRSGNGRDKMALQPSMIASCGRQILEATLYLHKLGLRPLGHIQSGNIFVEGEVCRLGGYESRLLGYRTRLYEQCKECGCYEDIDIAMFGHVIFEMACGYELSLLVPGEGEYRAVSDHAVRAILEMIFEREGGVFSSSLEQILAQPFFRDAHMPHLGEGAWSDHTPLCSDLQILLSSRKQHKTRRTQCSVQ